MTQRIRNNIEKLYVSFSGLKAQRDKILGFLVDVVEKSS